jgi:hypothetical protein
MLNGNMKKYNGRKEIREVFIFLSLVALAVIFRLIPHAPNFSPVASLAIFGGFYLSKRKAFFLPLLAIFFSDLVIGFYQPVLMFSVYLCFLLMAFIPLVFKRKRIWPAFLGSAFLGAISFFLITNFAVWAFSPWYPKTFLGLSQCYFMALPFFKQTLLSNLVYTSILVTSYRSVELILKENYFLRKRRTVSS